MLMVGKSWRWAKSGPIYARGGKLLLPMPGNECPLEEGTKAFLMACKTASPRRSWKSQGTPTSPSSRFIQFSIDRSITISTSLCSTEVLPASP